MHLTTGPFALGLAVLALTAAAEPYRDDLPVPSYRLLGGMLAQLRNNAPLSGAAKSSELVAPLARALDQKYGTEIQKALRRAIDAGDRDGAFAATTALVLLDTQDLLAGIANDDYTGWADAKVRTRKAFLNYGLVADDLRREQGELDRRTVTAFGRLAAELHDSDMTTPPEAIATLRGSVVAELVVMRTALGRTRSHPVDAGGGG